MLLPAYSVDVGMFMLGGSAVYGQAAITSAALVLVGIALWLNYRRLAAAPWIGVAGTVAATASVAIIASTPGVEQPNALWIIVAFLAVTAVLMALLLTRPKSRAYFAKG
jgi:hypothetical protein